MTDPHFQCVLRREGNLDAMVVRIEGAEHTTTDAAQNAGRRVAGLFKRTIGVTVDVDVVEPHTIERSVGKMKRLLDERPAR